MGGGGGLLYLFEVGRKTLWTPYSAVPSVIPDRIDREADD